MKKLVLLLLLIPFLAFKTSQSEKDFIGKWAGDDNSEIGYISFDKEGYAAFEINGQVLGGKEFEINGEKGKMVYKINMDVTPIEVDLIMTKFTSGEEKSLLCIAKFETTDNLHFAIGFDNIRPTNFDGDKMIELKRIK